jgi:glutamate 5-kinase
MRIAVKVGSSTLCDRGVPSIERIGAIVQFLQEFHKDNELILVSSGAVATGHGIVPALSNKKTPERQALAAVGQAALINIYANLFKPYGINVAQILITKDDLENFSRSENAKIALDTLLSHKILPIINENDTVVIDELLRGDNDQLSAKIAHFFDASVLVMLTDVDGYYDGDPLTNQNAKMIPKIDFIPDDALEQSVVAGGEFATGGVVTKLKAADFLLRRGKSMFLASGFDLTHARNFLKTGAYEKGTLFCAD